MFILINAPEGVLNDRCNVCGVFGNLESAQAMMQEDIAEVLYEFDEDPEDCCIGEMHGTCYLDRSDSPEWHIFEV